MNRLFQVSTLPALALGYTRPVVTVRELRENGDIGLGTFEDADGEMILLDGVCYQAKQNGGIALAQEETGVPFAVAGSAKDGHKFPMRDMQVIEAVKASLDRCIRADSALNSIHIARIDGWFESVHARSLAPYRVPHATLKEILSNTQREFCFERLFGTLVCVYFPGFLEGVNAAGWHMHFLSEDKTRGGHVFNASLREGTCLLQKIDRLEIQLPHDAAFDALSLKEVSKEEIREVEQGG